MEAPPRVSESPLSSLIDICLLVRRTLLAQLLLHACPSVPVASIDDEDLVCAEREADEEENREVACEVTACRVSAAQDRQQPNAQDGLTPEEGNNAFEQVQERRDNASDDVVRAL